VPPPTVAVIGHFEWVTHTRGEVPAAGQIRHLHDVFEQPAGGGAVTAAQMARLGAICRFFTAVGHDEAGGDGLERLGAAGVDVHAAERSQPHPRALTIVDRSGERTIVVTGGRVSPTLDDALPWDDLAACDGVYFIGDDPRTLIAARAARHLVVSARRLDVLIESGVHADVIVGSAADPDEVVDRRALPVTPRAVVVTEGDRGGRMIVGDREVRYAAVAPPGAIVDTYGAGDCFAGGLTLGLAQGRDLGAAAAFAAGCGADALTWRGGLGRST
jgi:ribokinase